MALQTTPPADQSLASERTWQAEPPLHLSEALTHAGFIRNRPLASRLGQRGGMFTRLSACPLNTLASPQARHRLGPRERPSHCKWLTCLLPAQSLPLLQERPGWLSPGRRC